MQLLVQHQMLVIVSCAHCHVFMIRIVRNQFLPTLSSSPHSFFHDSLVSNNLRALDDCMNDSCRSQPHTVHLAQVEQTGNTLEEFPASTDPWQLLFKMQQCGETLEQNFRDQCDKRRRRWLQPERVDLDHPLITYWWQ